jgi:hypothetical protein
MFLSQSIIIARPPNQSKTLREETTLFCSVLSATTSPDQPTLRGSKQAGIMVGLRAEESCPVTSDLGTLPFLVKVAEGRIRSLHLAKSAPFREALRRWGMRGASLCC